MRILEIQCPQSQFKMPIDTFNSEHAQKDPTILQCCLKSAHQEPYIGVDGQCDKSAIFCIEHSSHVNDEGLIHQMMPLKMFKRTVHSKKFIMQQKIEHLLDNFNKFMESLIEQIQELKLRKSIELSMLWLRELANNEEEYELMRKVYRMDFRDLSCQDIHSIYYKIIHNDSLYQKDVKEIKCYEGIMNVLEDIGQNQKAMRIISDKVTEIEGLLSSGKILQKILPDKRVLRPHIKEILLEESPYSPQKNFDINYHKAELTCNSTKFMSLFSKYPIIPHVTYHIAVKTKFSNVMFGLCSKSIKESKNQIDLHYNPESIVYNCANGYIYKDGMFVSGSSAEVKGMTEVVIKMRVTQEELILMTKEKVLMRTSITKIFNKNKGELYLHALGRTKGDYLEFQRDKDVSADNLRLIKLSEEKNEGAQNFSDVKEDAYNNFSDVKKDPYNFSDVKEDAQSFSDVKEDAYNNFSDVKKDPYNFSDVKEDAQSFSDVKEDAYNNFSDVKKDPYNFSDVKEDTYNNFSGVKKDPYNFSDVKEDTYKSQDKNQERFGSDTIKISEQNSYKNEKNNSLKQILGHHPILPSHNSKSDSNYSQIFSHEKRKESSIFVDETKRSKNQRNQESHYSEKTSSMKEFQKNKSDTRQSYFQNRTQSLQLGIDSSVQQSKPISYLKLNEKPKKSFQANSIIHERSQFSDADGKSMNFSRRDPEPQQNEPLKRTHNIHEPSHFEIDVSEENSYANENDCSKKEVIENYQYAHESASGRHQTMIMKIKTPPKISGINKKISDFSSPET